MTDIKLHPDILSCTQLDTALIENKLELRNL